MDAPKEIQDKLNEVSEEVERMLQIAHGHFETDISGPISFKYTISAPRDVLTDFERAQSVCFVTRYDALPVFEKINIVEEQGSYYFGNFHEVRYLLNEYRSIIQNKTDSIHFQHIHRFCRDKLLNNDHSKDLSITVEHSDRGDITQEFIKVLNEHYKAIRSLVNQCEFGYIYNGILQHSDHRYSHRFWEEYSSGKANYVFAKHALIASNIKMLLGWHYRLFSAMTFPKLGAL